MNGYEEVCGSCYYYSQAQGDGEKNLRIYFLKGMYLGRQISNIPGAIFAEQFIFLSWYHLANANKDPIDNTYFSLAVLMKRKFSF